MVAGPGVGERAVPRLGLATVRNRLAGPAMGYPCGTATRCLVVSDDGHRICCPACPHQMASPIRQPPRTHQKSHPFASPVNRRWSVNAFPFGRHALAAGAADQLVKLFRAERRDERVDRQHDRFDRCGPVMPVAVRPVASMPTDNPLAHWLFRRLPPLCGAVTASRRYSQIEPQRRASSPLAASRCAERLDN
jgi:hypothetical protein